MTHPSLGKGGIGSVEPTPEEIARKPAEEQAAADNAAARRAEAYKTKDYNDDADRQAFWDRVDTMTKDEFKDFVERYVVDQATAKQAIVRLALEVARLRR